MRKAPPEAYSRFAMFRLTRYFSITSLIAFAIVTALLGSFYRQNAIGDLIELEEEKNVALTQAFANSLWSQFKPFVASLSDMSGDELRVQPEVARLHQAVLAQMDGLSVVKVKLYNLDGLTIFSTELGQIGEDKSTNAGFLAARSGQIASELTHRDTFSAFEGTIEDRDVLSSYIPIRPNGPSGEVEAVFELYSDVTPLLSRIETTQWNVIGAVTLILALLYVVLFLIVRHADTVIRRQHLTQKRTEEELRKHREELEERVEERTAEIRRLLRQTQAQAEQIRQIIDTVPEGMLLLDHDCRIILANPVARRYLAELGQGEEGEIITHLGDQPLPPLLEKASECKGWYELRADEVRRIFEIGAEPLHEGPGAGGWLLVFHDATEEREREQRLRTQDRLATVGQLAAGIAHDFNNVLSVITLYAQILGKTARLTPSERERLVAINEQGQYGASLIRQILDFSRQSVVERTVVDLLPFVKEVVKLLDRTLPGEVRLKLDWVEEAPYIVNADLTRIQQVLMNLAINARDAMPQGGLLRIQLRHTCLRASEAPPLPDMPPGEWIELRISDTGCGIPPEHLSRVFEPFFTTKARGEGTGLGLAQVYGIIQQHEGYIDVTSQVGQGTTFTIYLPALSHAMSDCEETAAAIVANGKAVKNQANGHRHDPLPV